jgi:hypothetical protein
MSTFSIPLGNISADDIPASCESLIDRVAADLFENFGTGISVSMTNIVTQHQVADDNKTVGLFTLKRDLNMRVGLTEGVTVNFSWHRKCPEELLVSIRHGSCLEDWGFYIVFVAAGLTAFFFGAPLVGRSSLPRTTTLVMFLGLTGAIMIPYQLFRVLMGISGQSFTNGVVAVIQNRCLPGENSNSK